MKFPLPNYTTFPPLRAMWLTSEDVAMLSNPSLNEWLWLWDGITGHEPILVAVARRLDNLAAYVEICGELFDVRQIEGGLWFPDHDELYEA